VFEKPKSDLTADLLCAVGAGDLPRWHGGVETTANLLAESIKAEIPSLRLDFPGALGAPLKIGPAYDAALASSAMAVNLSRRNDAYLYSSDRIAQVMGSGQLTFIDRATGLGLFFAEEEAGFYSTEDELIDKLRFYSEHDLERQEIGRAGWKKYRTLFNSTRIASYMVDVVYGLIDPAEFRWNTSETTTV
jgi:hypothetical protein